MPDELKSCPFCGSDGVPTGTGYARCVNGYCPQSKYPYPSTVWNTRPIEDALRAENAKLKARVEAAEELIEAQESFDAAVGLPECWSDKKEYERDLEKTMTRLRAAREKWGEVSK